MDSNAFDLAGVGIGPFNLALAALLDPVGAVSAVFLDGKERFSWHPGMLIEGAQLQVPFLADLVTLADPTSRWSFLSFLREHDRLFPFYFAERFHIPRAEYDAYCRWVAERLPTCQFGHPVQSVSWNASDELFMLDTGSRTILARNIVLGVGTEPVVPPEFRGLDGIIHSAEYLHHRDVLANSRDVTVVGSGQSGAEVFGDLLRQTSVPSVRWLTRAPAFAPMEYSKLGLEHFTPDYRSYFRGLRSDLRDALVPQQWQLYKAISADTISDIHDSLYENSISASPREISLSPNIAVLRARSSGGSIELSCQERLQDAMFDVVTDAVVLATGYRARRPDFLAPMSELIDWDAAGRYRIDADYRVATAESVTGGIYVQNAELHTDGVGAPDLGLGAHRAAVITNSVAGKEVYRLPTRTAFTTFGAPKT